MLKCVGLIDFSGVRPLNVKNMCQILNIIDGEHHVHEEQAGRIVVSGHDLAECLYSLFDSHEFLQVVSKSGKIKMTYYIDCQV